MTRTTHGQISTHITSGVIYQAYGSVPPTVRTEGEDMMARLSEVAPGPVVHAKLKVTSDEDRAPAQRSVVQGTLDVSGTILRGEAAGPTASEALGAVGSKMERRLQRLAERRQQTAEQLPSTSPDTWHSGDSPRCRPDFFHLPPEQRHVVRRKVYSPADRISVDEALFDLEVLDYRFFLFTDEADEHTTIVYEDDDGVAIRKVDGSAPDDGSSGPAIHINRTPAPSISLTDAISRLDESDVPFIFFKTHDRARASVLYRRYDGHYGLIVPSTPLA